MAEQSKIENDKEITQLKSRIKELESQLALKNAPSEAQEQFKVISETSPQAIMIYQNNVWVYANKAATEISGYSVDELMGKNFWFFVHPEYIDIVKNMGTKRQSSVKAAKNYEFKIITKTGIEKWVWLNGGTTIYKGKPAGVISVQDITDRKVAIEKLKESEERFKFLTKATFEGVVVHKKGIVQDANDAFLKMSGYKRNEVVGQNLLDYIPLIRDKAKIMVNIVKNRAKPYLITARHKSGSYFTAELEAKDVIHNGQTIRIAAVRDVTAREEAREQLQEAHERLETMNSILRHDISNELSVIDSALELFINTHDEKMLEEMRSRIDKCIHTIREQHYLAKELKKKKSGKRTYELLDIFKSIEKNHHDIEFSIEGNAHVMANAGIFSVFDNLISNSIIHGKATKISFRVDEDEECCIVSYKDNGSGIADELKDRVFEEGFFAGKTGHTGIGMNIIQKTMKDYGGKVTLEDNIPNGVFIKLYFPKINFKE